MIGRVLGGRYEILEAIDSGGMAYVYKAFCRKTNSTVAIKVLKEKFSNNTEYVKRFKKEAQAVFSIEHENIVRVSDIGCDEGLYYMVMEHIPGSNLKALINKDGKIPEREAILFAIQICSGLSAAHKRGIIHRDIKPQNILLDKDQTAKVTDFGIAKSISASNEEEKEVIGSVYYVSPEQARGDNVDARTDIYSLGIMLYEMLTGELPYTGDQTVSVALKHINEKITAPIVINNSLSKSINNIVLKATSKNKKDRYRSMDAFREDLVRALVDTNGDFVDLPSEAQTREIFIGNNHKLWKIIILVAITAIIVASIVTVVAWINQSNKQNVVVTDYVGQNIENVSRTLTDMEFDVQIEFQPSETIDEGIVMAQKPDAGATIKKGGSVVLTVSSGPTELIIPDLTDLTLEDAKNEIESMGLVIDAVTYEYHSDMPADVVLSQMPEAGSEVAEDSTVNLVVSTDIEETDVPVPLLSGSTVDQAVALLYESGFTTCYVIESESELGEGIVFEQTPAEGIPTSYDHEVDLWISQYSQKDYHAVLSTQVDVADSDSKIKIVLESEQNNVLISYVVETMQATDIGQFPINIDILSISEGNKMVKVFVNNVETYSQEMEFVERVAE